MGQANSRETKYRYRWIPTDEKPERKQADEMKAKGEGGWRKRGGSWVWHLKVENDNTMGDANTLLKMACKRALVAAVLNTTAASDIFAQDLEDLPPDAPPAVTEETLQALAAAIDTAAQQRSDLWADAVVLKNASVRFNRVVNELGQLSEEEAQQILKGATTWLAQNPPPEPEGENVPAADVEVMPEEGDANGS